MRALALAALLAAACTADVRLGGRDGAPDDGSLADQCLCCCASDGGQLVECGSAANTSCECTAAADCPAGYACEPELPNGVDLFCLPDCSQVDDHRCPDAGCNDQNDPGCP
jgi:hypothetical protein